MLVHLLLNNRSETSWQVHLPRKQCLINRNWRLAKALKAIDSLSVIWKSDLTDKIIHSFSQAAVVLILLYRCTTLTLTKRMEKKLDGNYTRMLRAISNKYWRQQTTKQQLYGHLPSISKTIKIRRTRHAGHCWRSRDVLISDVLLWTPSHGRAKAERPARTYRQQLCVDMRCSSEDLPEAMDDREGWRERVRDIRADGATWWWWLKRKNFASAYMLRDSSCHSYYMTFVQWFYFISISPNQYVWLKICLSILSIYLWNTLAWGDQCTKKH